MSKKAKENGPLNRVKSRKFDWKKFDIRSAVKKDISAAVAMLSMLLDNPALFELVVHEIESWRDRMIEQEKSKPS